MNYIDYLKPIQTPTIVQIGAHDGVLGEEYGLQDYLKTLKNCNVFFVEPIEKYFANLKNVYAFLGNNAVFCNHAITNKDGPVMMFDAEGMSRITSEGGDCQVLGLSWQSFQKQHSIDIIDLLLLDCEGYEFEILKQINFTNQQAPKIIRYEHYHIPNQKECRDFLISHGYTLSLCHYDSVYNTVAVKL